MRKPSKAALQARRIEQLEATLAELKQRFEDLERRFARLEILLWPVAQPPVLPVFSSA